ncbi:MAG: PqqD family protein [Deltaproteobacteria bacterium]|nr:PqqD family protein [Deltaproteobacteria bacterium]
MVVVMAREALHSLNESGTFLWNVIGDQERTRGELCSALARRYELSRERAESDVSAFLEQLLELGALEEGSRG